MKISIVIPIYNEEENLPNLHKRMIVVCKSLNIDYEIIYVDDGSIDKSLDLIENFTKQDNNTYFISFYRNFGQHAAVIAGFKYSKGDVVMTLDADLQNPPEEIPKFIEKMKEDYDVVAGVRLNRKDNLLRKFLSYFMNKIISMITGVKLVDYGCMMRLYKRNIINILIRNE